MLGSDSFPNSDPGDYRGPGSALVFALLGCPSRDPAVARSAVDTKAALSLGTKVSHASGPRGKAVGEDAAMISSARR